MVVSDTGENASESNTTVSDPQDVISIGPPSFNFGTSSLVNTVNVPKFYNYRDHKSGLTVKIVTTVPKI